MYNLKLAGSRRVASHMPKNESGATQRKHRPDYQIVLFMGLLMLLGLIIIYAIGPARANVLNSINGTDFYTGNYFVAKQLISLAIAVVGFIVMSTIPFEKMRRYSWRLVQIGFILCILLFLFGNLLHIDKIATNTLGAYRWFNLGPIGSFQPAEVLKFALLIYIAGFLGTRYSEGKINDLKATIYPLCAIVLVALFFVVVLQKDFGTGAAMLAVVVAMLIISNIKWSILIKIAVVCLALGVLAIISTPHRMERINTFLGLDQSKTGELDNKDNDYQINNAMIALGSGGAFGRGVGRSIQATGYLPEATNDSIFAILGETFGFIGTFLTIGLFGALFYRLLRVVDYLHDMPMKLAVAGIFGWLSAHVLMNIASMLGMMPLTGITLPMLSFGGTSLVFMTSALGLAFQLSRYTSHSSVITEEAGHEDTYGRRGIGRTRYASRRSIKRG